MQFFLSVLLPALLPVLAVFAVYAIVYSAGRYFKPIGEMYGFALSLVGFPFVLLEHWLSEKVPGGENKRPTLITLLSLVSLGAATVSGDIALIMQALPYLTNEKASRVLIDAQLSLYSQSALFSFPILLAGLVVLEIYGYTSDKLFKQKTQYGKWFKRYACSTLVLAILLAVSFFVYRRVYIATGGHSGYTLTLGYVVFGFLSLVVPLSAILAFEALRLGATGLCLLIVQLLGSILDFLATFFSRGKFSPRTLFGSPTSSDNTEEQLVPLPVQASYANMDAQTNGSLPASSQRKEMEVFPMSASENVTCLTLNGVLGSRLQPHVKRSFSYVKWLIRSSGRVDTLSSRVCPVGLGLDVSPKQQGLSAKEQFDLMGENIVQAHSPVSTLPAVHVHVLDPRDGADAFGMLRDNKRRLPGITQVVVTALTPADLASSDVQAFLSGLAVLWQEGVIAPTVRFDLSSELVRSLGEEKFFAYVARFLSDLVVSERQSQHNLSAVALFDRIAKASPFLSLSIATVSVAHGKTPVRGWFARLFTNKAVTANINDLLTQALQVVNQVMYEPETRAFPQEVSPLLSCALVFDVPLSLADGLFSIVEERNNQQVLMDNSNYRRRRIILAAHVMKRSDDCSVCTKWQP